MKLITTTVRLNEQDLKKLNQKTSEFGVSQSALLRLGLKRITDNDIQELKNNMQLVGF